MRMTICKDLNAACYVSCRVLNFSHGWREGEEELLKEGERERLRSETCRISALAESKPRRMLGSHRCFSLTRDVHVLGGTFHFTLPTRCVLILRVGKGGHADVRCEVGEAGGKTENAHGKPTYLREAKTHDAAFSIPRGNDMSGPHRCFSLHAIRACLGGHSTSHSQLIPF
jgi:hypothetical protein